jgi:uncharacterized membrane protein (UPF0127 family)
LVKDGVVLASIEVAGGRAAKARGLLGRDGIDGVLVLDGVRSVHTIGMRFAIDVAFCDRDGLVLRSVTVPRWRVTRPVPRAARVIEAEAGAFSRWGVAVGDRIELR